MPNIAYVAETGSTNADLLARIAAGERLHEDSWLVADRQTAGRGRQGRAWLDAPGNFMGSTAVLLGSGDPPAASLSFAAALAVYETVACRLPDPRLLMLKWPNDVLLAGEKFCGILLERSGDYAIIGIGVNLAAAPAVVGRETRSLADLGPTPDRDSFAAALAGCFAAELGRWRSLGMASLLARWIAAAHPAGARLSVHDGQGQMVRGAFDGLQPDGALRLRLDNGTARVIHAGDIEMERE